MKRVKHSDQFERSAGYFGIHRTFAQAFPAIASVGVVVKINGRGSRSILGDERRFDATLNEFVDCLDPECRDGGFQIGAVLDTMVKNGEAHKKDSAGCNGRIGGHPLAAWIRNSITAAIFP